MWNDLTLEQRRGFNWAAKLRNAHNATAGGRTNWSGQEMAAECLAERSSVLYAELMARKIDRIANKIKTMTQAEQDALFASLQIDGAD